MTEQREYTYPPSFDWKNRRHEDRTDINVLAILNHHNPIILSIHDGEKESAVSMSIATARKLVKKLNKKIKQAESVYNPNGWNKYPEVTPPEGVPMMLEVVEHSFNRGDCENYEGWSGKAIFKPFRQTVLEDDGVTKIEINDPRWFDPAGDQLIERYGISQDEKEFVAYFRPWPELE